jgi:hypothetical protein
MAESVRERFLTGVGLLVAVLVASGCITADVKYRHTDDGGSGGSSAVAAEGFSDDRTKIEVISAKVGGKNIFIPGTWVFTEGEGRVLSFFNTTGTPHGMSIPALGIAEILQPGVEQVVTLPTLEGGNVYDVHCHLHPPHRGATLVVLRAR